MTTHTSGPDYRAEAVRALVEKLNAGEDRNRPQRWEPVIPHDTVITVFPGYVIQFGDGFRRDRWYYLKSGT
ncbi:hypothetical protein [Streptomyces halobius]|uniref:Uncharacterized protein n=1 Tax=Streptomyces halobius TaxID=2879846 RepID=A0ABY4M2L7_9ACTN|nr:hypothetical protein [Streptomyces halobius]UQA91652.1 hypothetical protein K9S39_07055 [Streptomyces halobius]